MGDVEVSIKIEIKPTERHPVRTGEVERVDEGHFRLVLNDQDPLDIDALEQGLLRTNYPALRDALAQHLLDALEIALMDGVDPKIPRLTVGLRGAPLADGGVHGAGFLEAPPLPGIGR